MYNPYMNLYTCNTNRTFIDEGSLQIAVFTNNEGNPVNNASINITPKDDDTHIIDKQITNNSGQSSIINLAAPPIEDSLNPNGQKPYSEYNLIITAEGYEPSMIKGIQIFPQTMAKQNIFITPSVYSNTFNIISIKEPVLFGNYPAKIMEEEIKELPTSSGFVVLSEPVIPEYIIVHDGLPTNASAQNYWIPFKDYIKNVASCEIYPTWPEETIKANILAIISFTLNRVYTEWYRNKGYDFTITSSTAYDHAFNYGRNIYNEISLIVDNIFNTYITKPNIRQPLFAQYCDGKRINRPNWMSQWGSKTLGDQGYNSIDILKHFYGQDIYLMGAEKVSGVPYSFIGTNLQIGSTGLPVRTIQEQLNTISNNYPAINKIKVDGIFGEQTSAAVKTFQDIFNVPCTGIVDFATWYRISDIYVAVTKIAELY